jgi:hypothetical protein
LEIRTGQDARAVPSADVISNVSICPDKIPVMDIDISSTEPPTCNNIELIMHKATVFSDLMYMMSTNNIHTNL